MTAEFFPKGIKNLSAAVEEDNKHHLEEALRLYQISFEYFFAGLKCKNTY
jgi:hypothetical protein